MPPEVLRKQKITSKTDVWSFGVVIHEICYAGKLPWPNLPILEDLPRAAEIMETEELLETVAVPEIDKLMKNCLKNYKRRPAFSVSYKRYGYTREEASPFRQIGLANITISAMANDTISSVN
ncbi:unnamed protein product [Oikopleura dioica]|uniref:Protein kinase domain-containing protein n=1 Tax=Oikopleura dioica TaxID=34765 RepID=E4Y084_OIKDI|nr:unnamed protein product [Oikopleura dioica]